MSESNVNNSGSSTTKRVLFVGNDDLFLPTINYLITNAGVQDVTLLDGEAAADAGADVSLQIEQLKQRHPGVKVTTRNEDALSLIQRDEEFVLSFSLVVAVNVARPIEEALGEILYQAPPRALIISRRSQFNVKMRSQYKRHRVTDEPGTPVIEGIDLHPHPEDYSPDKAKPITKALGTTFDLTSSSLRQYLLLVAASAKVFAEENGHPPGHRPGTKSISHLQDQVIEEGKKLLPEVKLDKSDLEICCKDGFSALRMTTEIMGTLIGAEGSMLLLEKGRPINNALLQWTAGAVLGIEVVG